jgi:hypothetical protein
MEPNMEIETKGFFKLGKRPAFLISTILLFVIIIFSPLVYNIYTAGGTAVHLICINIVLILAPTFGLIDALLRKEE